MAIRALTEVVLTPRTTLWRHERWLRIYEGSASSATKRNRALKMKPHITKGNDIIMRSE